MDKKRKKTSKGDISYSESKLISSPKSPQGKKRKMRQTSLDDYLIFNVCKKKRSNDRSVASAETTKSKKFRSSEESMEVIGKYFYFFIFVTFGIFINFLLVFFFLVIEDSDDLSNLTTTIDYDGEIMHKV